MKVVSMVEFCIREKSLTKIKNYAEFLKRPLHMFMFVALDNEGNFLNIPSYNIENDSKWSFEFYKYEEAREKIIFSNWSWKGTYAEHTSGLAIDDEICKQNTMEELIMNGYDLYLTPYAVKLLGL